GWDLPADVQTSFGVKLTKGKTCIVEMEIWEDMLVRSQRGHSMKDKPFRLVRIRMLHTKTGQPLLKNVCGSGYGGRGRWN
ncbi:MAG: hypothetical protein ACI8P3_000710, partial [Saprospiraceae bacterium]